MIIDDEIPSGNNSTLLSALIDLKDCVEINKKVLSLDGLNSWNNNLENEVGPGNKTMENDETIMKQSETICHILHTEIVKNIMQVRPACFLRYSNIQTCDKGNEQVNWKIADVTNINLESEEEANQISEDIASDLSLFTSTKIELNCNDLVGKEEHMASTKEKHTLILVAELLRTTKNVIRCNRIIFSKSESFRESAPYCNPVRRIQSVGMIHLYLHLLKGNFRMGTKLEDDSSIRDDIARYSSHSLLHATFTYPTLAESSKGLSALIKHHNWVFVLVKLILIPNDIPLMVSLIRHLHNLLGSQPKILTEIDLAVEQLTNGINNSDTDPSQDENNLLKVIVSTLAWTLRSEPTFPGSHNSDRRSDLVIEILRVLFVISNFKDVSLNKLDESNLDSMTHVGNILLDLINLPSENVRSFKCKLSAICLLMDAPSGYIHFLVKNKAIGSLIEVLEIQLNDAVVEPFNSVYIAGNETALLPILIVLKQMSKLNSEVKTLVKNTLFPLENEGNFIEAKSKKGKDVKNMKPIDAPNGTLRWKIIQLMTWTESNVKRCASELLWTLCDSNPTEFILRTGFGNAIHMLGIKGVVDIKKNNIGP